MAVAFLSTPNTFLSLSLSNTLSPLTTISSSSSSSNCPQKHNVITKVPLWKATEKESPFPSSPCLSKRNLALSFSSAFLLSLAGKCSAAVLEAEDDLELLEKVKKDRKKRIEKQGIIKSSTKETGYLQDVVYKLSEVGKAIDNKDLNAASLVLGNTTETDWIKRANSAFTKLSSSDEEKAEVDIFNTSISNLISSVIKKDMESSKIAFVSSASALEKWTALTGLNEQLKGL